MENGRLRAAEEMSRTPEAAPGCSMANASAVMPPMEAPTTEYSRAIPNDSMTACPALAMSSRHSVGKLSR